MFVNGLGTANPPYRYSKAECWEALKTSDWFLKLPMGMASRFLISVLMAMGGRCFRDWHCPRRGGRSVGVRRGSH